MALSSAVPLQVLHGASAHATLTLPSNSSTVHFGCKCAVCYVQRLQNRTGEDGTETRFSTSKLSQCLLVWPCSSPLLGFSVKAVRTRP